MEVPSLSQVLPWIEQIGVGAIAGFVSGFAIKKIGKAVALALGLLVVSVQFLAWGGYVTVDWVKLQTDVEPWLRTEALNEGWSGLVDVLTYNAPFAVAFVPALIAGLRRG